MSKNLIRGLSLVDATAIIVGTIIGTGVFLKTAKMAQVMGNSSWVIAAWVFAGLLSLTGALSYAELGAMMPKAGGEYVYLREGFGKKWAFLYGWMRFWIGGPGSIAAYAVGSMTFLSAAVDLSWLGGKNIAAVMVICIFSALNCMAVSMSGKVHTFLTSLKVIMIFGLTFGIFLLSPPVNTVSILNTQDLTTGFAGFSAFGTAMLAALWAYDGWNNLSMVAGEIKEPQRNIPRSFILGMFTILIIYLLTNWAYFYSLPLSEVQSSSSSQFPQALPVATKAAITFMGENGAIVLSLAFVLSALGAMNGSILTGARVPFAMASDGLFLKKISELSKKTSVPIYSIMIQAAVAIALALSGTFDQLTDYVVFAAWIFYAMVTGVVFVLRRRMPDAPRAYKAVGYPIIPAIFIIVAILLLINTVITDPKGSGIGLLIILAGVPVYYYFNSKNKSAT